MSVAILLAQLKLTYRMPVGLVIRVLDVPDKLYWSSGIADIKFIVKLPVAFLTTLLTFPLALMVGGVVVPSKLTHALQA